MKKYMVPFVLGAASTSAQSFTADLDIKTCTTEGGCKTEKKRVALDSTSLATKSLIESSGDTLKLSYKHGVGGPRVYMIEEEGKNENKLFMLNGHEFTFDVELSTMKCGFNAALYFVGMTPNSGEADKGVKYCDAQAVAGVFCAEMDIMEANTMAQQFTTHGCDDKCATYTDGSGCKKGVQGVCDQNGCGYNPFRYGPGTSWNTETNNADFHGPGSQYDLDTTKLFTVVTQFKTSASGELTEIHRFYVQDDKKIELPASYVLKPKDGQHKEPDKSGSISPTFCTDIYDRWKGDAPPLAQMGNNMKHGMVLTMSAWYDAETYPLSGEQTGMSWLDGENHWASGITKAGPCHESTSDAGGPYYAKFSNIRVGDIGTTLGPSPPTDPPTPPTPPSPGPPSPGPPSPPSPGPSPPSPGGGKCCYGASCTSCQGGWCGQSESHCVGNCHGHWCPSDSADDIVV